MRKAALILLLLGATLARAAEPSNAIVLVARPELQDAMFRASVVVVAPLANGAHAGFIVNHPTQTTLATLFPGHEASRRVDEPVYVGGPVMPDALFALVRAAENPGGRSFELMPGLYAAFEEPVIDRIIEAHPESARFVAGFVAWQPGELESEVELGAWYVMDPDSTVLARSAAGLWEDLLKRFQRPAGFLYVGGGR